MSNNVVQILYSGMGGTASVAFSLVEGDVDNRANWHFIFYGIEDLEPDFIKKCEELNIEYTYFKKEKQGSLDIATLNKIMLQAEDLNAVGIILHTNILIPHCYRFKLKHRNCKVIFTEHSSPYIKSRKDWVLSRLAFSMTDHVVFLSTQFKETLKNRIPFFFKEKKSTVIPNGIKLNLFKAKEKNKKEAILLGMASRLEPVKRIPTIMDALILLREKSYFNKIIFQLAGTGSMIEEWKNLAKKNGIAEQFVFMGMLGEKELVQFYQQLDIYIHATEGEMMSTAIMQAQATALPVIASDVKGVNNMIVDGETGLLTLADNATDLAEKIDLLINDSEKRHNLGLASRKYAEQFYSSERMSRNYLDLILN